MLIAWPWALGPRPTGGTRRALAQWAAQSMGYTMVAMIAFVLAAVGALLILRKQREAFRDEARENIRELIEGSLRDHGRDP